MPISDPRPEPPMFADGVWPDYTEEEVERQFRVYVPLNDQQWQGIERPEEWPLVAEDM